MRTCRLIGVFLLLAVSRQVEAQNCSKGKPCGNSCIAREKVCRVGQGTARWAPGADTITGVVQQAKPNAPVGRDTTLGAIPPAKRAVCVVARVMDGDTIRCSSGPDIRLLLIDAPERSQGPYGAAATRGLQRFVTRGDTLDLEMDVEEYDRYNRRLAYAYSRGGQMVNEEMARAGLVLVLVYPPNVKYVERIRAAVAEAREARRGLWATSAFECAPVDRRRGRC